MEGGACAGEVEASNDPAALVLARAPASTLAGQEKVFERLGHGWLRRVFHRWQLPPWAWPSPMPSCRSVPSRLGSAE
eukprot:7643525-Lingulodinium_polyedra.AAC.1